VLEPLGRTFGVWRAASPQKYARASSDPPGEVVGSVGVRRHSLLKCTGQPVFGFTVGSVVFGVGERRVA